MFLRMFVRTAATLSLIALGFSFVHADESYWLMVPPDFVGQASAGSTPNRNWISVGTYGTQSECEAAKQSSSMEFFTTTVDAGAQSPVAQTAKKLPDNAACVPSTAFDGDNSELRHP